MPWGFLPQANGTMLAALPLLVGRSNKQNFRRDHISNTCHIDSLVAACGKRGERIIYMLDLCKRMPCCTSIGFVATFAAMVFFL